MATWSCTCTQSWFSLVNILIPKITSQLCLLDNITEGKNNSKKLFKTSYHGWRFTILASRHNNSNKEDLKIYIYEKNLNSIFTNMYVYVGLFGLLPSLILTHAYLHSCRDPWTHSLFSTHQVPACPTTCHCLVTTHSWSGRSCLWSDWLTDFLRWMMQ